MDKLKKKNKTLVEIRNGYAISNYNENKHPKAGLFSHSNF